MAIEVRLLRHGDETVLDRVAADVFDDPIDAEAAARFLSDPRHLLAVALDAGVVVAFTSARTPDHPERRSPGLRAP